jgi:hypothetical protein
MANEFVIKNGYFSQGNSNVTGSLQVTGSVGVTGSASITGSLTSIGTSTFSGSVLMTGSLNAIVSGAIDLTGFITASKIFITSSNGNQLTIIGSGSTLAQIYGSQGNLLTVNDTFSGSIFTVTDISGYPILDVTSDYYTSSINTIGFLNHTGSLIVSGGFIVRNTTNGNKVIDSVLSNLYYSDGDVSVGWADSFLKDTDNAVSINWDARLLIANDNSTTHIDWDNPSYMKFPSVNASVPIINVLGLDSNSNLYITASTAFGGGSTFNSTSSIIGDGVNTTYTVTHGFNTKNLHITVYETSSNGETVYPDIRRDGLNTAQIVFANPPSSGSYIVYISQ